MDTAYDVIIIGAGPNGLTCAAYLAKAGLRTLLIERRFEAGGGLSTDDFGSPFRFNLHATYMMLAELTPPHTDLELADNVAFIRPASQVAFVYRDGKALVLYTDPARSAESVRRLCPEDAPRFETMWADFRRMCDDILIPATYVPPLPILDQLDLLGRTELGKRVSEISEMTPRDIVESYGFHDDRVKAAVLHLATMWGLLPDAPGVGYMVPIYVYRMMNAALVKGGTHTLSSALHTAMLRAGGEYLESAEAHRLVMENGAVRGIELSDGRQFRARAIVSTLNPEQNFLRLLARDDVAPDLREAAAKWEWEEWSLFTMHVGIKGDPPQYRAAEFNPDVNTALITVMGSETPADIERHAAELEAGELPAPAGGGTCTSLHDSLQASRGPFGPLHTLRWESWAPYALADGRRWDDTKLDYANECLSAWAQHAPNLARAKVLFKYVYSPLDIERRLHTMKRGSIKHGAYGPLQMGSLRPNDLCSGYRTPLSGFYVGGASVYPGGMITLGPGYNAARVVAEDLGASVWWKPPAYVELARQHGYL